MDKIIGHTLKVIKVKNELALKILILSLQFAIVGVGLLFANVLLSFFVPLLFGFIPKSLGYGLWLSDVVINLFLGVIAYLLYRFVTEDRANHFLASDSDVIGYHNFVVGMTFALVLFIGVVAYLVVSKKVAYQDLDFSWVLIINFMFAFAFTWFEEIVFRGIVQNLIGQVDKFAGVWVSAVVFTIYLLFTSELVGLNFFIGLFLSLVAYFSRDIYFGFGFNFIWRFLQVFAGWRVRGFVYQVSFLKMSLDLGDKGCFSTAATADLDSWKGMNLIFFIFSLILLSFIGYRYYVQKKQRAKNINSKNV